MTTIQINLADLLGKIEAIPGGAAESLFGRSPCGLPDCDCSKDEPAAKKPIMGGAWAFLKRFMPRTAKDFVTGLREVDSAVINTLRSVALMAKHELIDAEAAQEAHPSEAHAAKVERLSAKITHAELLLKVFQVNVKDFDEALAEGQHTDKATEAA